MYFSRNIFRIAEEEKPIKPITMYHSLEDVDEIYQYLVQTLFDHFITF